MSFIAVFIQIFCNSVTSFNLRIFEDPSAGFNGSVLNGLILGLPIDVFAADWLLHDILLFKGSGFCITLLTATWPRPPNPAILFLL